MAVPNKTSMMSRTWPSGLGPGSPGALRHRAAAFRIAVICSIVSACGVALVRRSGEVPSTGLRAMASCRSAKPNSMLSMRPGLLGLRRRPLRLLRQEPLDPARWSPRRGCSARRPGGHGAAGRSDSSPWCSRRGRAGRGPPATGRRDRRTSSAARGHQRRARPVAPGSAPGAAHRAAAAVGPEALACRSRPSRSRTRVSATTRPPSRRRRRSRRRCRSECGDGRAHQPAAAWMALGVLRPPSAPARCRPR